MTMKHWNELNSLEETIHELERVKVCLDILMESEQMNSYHPDGISRKYQTFLYDVHERFTQAHDALVSDFDALWDSVRTDSQEVESIAEGAEAAEAAQRWDQILSGLPEGPVSLADGDGSIPTTIHLDNQN